MAAQSYGHGEAPAEAVWRVRQIELPCLLKSHPEACLRPPDLGGTEAGSVQEHEDIRHLQTET